MTREALGQAEATREKSANLRSTLDAIYVNSVRDLRTQADRVDAVLAEKVNITQQCCERLEKELLRVRNGSFFNIKTKRKTGFIFCLLYVVSLRDF